MRSFLILVDVLFDSVNNSQKLTWLHITAVAAMWRSVSPSDKPIILPCMPRICGGRCAEKSVRDRMTLPCPVNSLAAFRPVPLRGDFIVRTERRCFCFERHVCILNERTVSKIELHENSCTSCQRARDPCSTLAKCGVSIVVTIRLTPTNVHESWHASARQQHRHARERHVDRAFVVSRRDDDRTKRTPRICRGRCAEFFRSERCSRLTCRATAAVVVRRTRQ